MIGLLAHQTPTNSIFTERDRASFYNVASHLRRSKTQDELTNSFEYCSSSRAYKSYTAFTDPLSDFSNKPIFNQSVLKCINTEEVSLCDSQHVTCLQGRVLHRPHWRSQTSRSGRPFHLRKLIRYRFLCTIDIPVAHIRPSKIRKRA